MMTSSNGNIFRVTGHLCGEFTGPGTSAHKGQWRGALVLSLLCVWMAPSHYLNQHWNCVNWTLGNKLQRNFNRNSNTFIQWNPFENVCEMASICLGLNVLKMNIRFAIGKHLHRFPINAHALRIEKNVLEMLIYVGYSIEHDWELWSYYGLSTDFGMRYIPQNMSMFSLSFLIPFMCSIKSYHSGCFPSIKKIVWPVLHFNTTQQHNVMYGVCVSCDMN